MSSVYILKIDSLSHVFTTLESGSKCQFQFKLINNDNVSDVIQSLAINDVLLCVIEGTVKHALRVKNKTNNSATLEKEFELKDGYEITNNQILSRLNERQICLVDETFKRDLYNSLKDRFNLMLAQMLEVNIENTENNPSNTQSFFFFNFSSNFIPTQIIYYGVPGCGKSHTVDAEINKSISEYNKGKDESDKISYEKQVIRVVFHPDYGNSDFIGQIMPKLRERGGVDYVFKPGPLAQILRMAYLNSDKPYFLVVEEINRGNAAAIFGETFQLLDRIKDGKKDKNGYGPGWSSYSILNDDVNDYIRDIKAYENFEHSGCVKTNHPKDMINGDGNLVDAPDVNGHKEIDFSTATSYCSLELILQGFDCPQTFRESTAIRLPPNLSIYATMNTSDQNVFTLDNAFQRRWEMKQVPNDLKDKIPANASEEEKKNIQAEIDQYNEIIGNTNVKWGDFRKAVNEVIMDSAQANGLSSMEDKRLGGWFFTPPDNFAEKVLKYLWDDAFKFDRPNQFTGFKTLEELVTNFNTAGFKVFKDDRISKLQKDSSTMPNGSAQNDTPVVDG